MGWVWWYLIMGSVITVLLCFFDPLDFYERDTIAWYGFYVPLWGLLVPMGLCVLVLNLIAEKGRSLKKIRRAP